MASRRSRIIALVVCITVLAMAAAVIIAATIELQPLVERYAARSLQRKLTFGELRIRWGVPLSVEIRDLHLANASWGSEPDMLSVAHLAAEIDPWPLLRGVLQYRKLTIEGAVLLLERDPAGQPNWHFSGSSKPSSGPIAIIPANRTQFPSLRDLSLTGTKFIYRLPGSRDLRADLANMAIRSADDSSAVTMDLDGAYNDMPVRVKAEMASFSDLRDAAKPFHTVLSMTPPSGTLAFDGTMTDPLNFDGVDGQLRIETQKLGTILTALGAGTDIEVPLRMSGTLDRSAEHWKLADAKGDLMGNAFTGELALTEAARGQPDQLAISLAFPRLDLEKLVAGAARPDVQARKSESLSLLLEAKPLFLIQARIDAGALSYGAVSVKNAAARGQNGAGSISVGEISFDYGNGHATMSGEGRSVAAGSRITARMDLSEIDMSDVSRLLDAPGGEITGKLNGRAVLDMTGENLRQALAGSQGQAVLEMTKGGIDRALLEKVSTDVRALFRTNHDAADISCLLAVAILDGGVATVSPFRMRTQDATLVAGGTVDIARQKVDLSIGTVRESTSLFALDVPMRLVGDLGSLHALPDAARTDLLRKAERDGSPGKLTPELRGFAESNPCIR
ncbi:MAG TPA: AsmA-like C-terminal region-containing protein [Aliidongia sp.]|nr:AsmA-like C-terminal region-containing protein [Aliidongia sp.]